jgi:ADP-heptose:LPS heptosyltransferase
MTQLDLVISVDTSCAHLASALGRPLWIIIPAVPGWRWEFERTDTPWYGSARLFPQARFGDSSDVFAEMAAALRELVECRGWEAV